MGHKTVAADASEEEIKSIALAGKNVQKFLERKEPKKVIVAVSVTMGMEVSVGVGVGVGVGVPLPQL